MQFLISREHLTLIEKALEDIVQQEFRLNEAYQGRGSYGKSHPAFATDRINPVSVGVALTLAVDKVAQEHPSPEELTSDQVLYYFLGDDPYYRFEVISGLMIDDLGQGIIVEVRSWKVEETS